MSASENLLMEEKKLAFQYRIELSWQYKIFNLGLPYVGADNTVRLGSIYVPLTFHLSRGNVQDREQLGDILAKHTNLVLLGGPGSGKSMLCQVLAYAFSKEGGEPWTRGLGINRMPILMTLREYDISAWHSIDDMLAQYINKMSIVRPYQKPSADAAETRPQARFPVGLRETVSVSWLRQCLEQGKALLIWDGMDEIGDIGARRKLREFFDREIEKKRLSRPTQPSQ